MRKVLLMILVCWLSVVVKSQGQEVSFLSSDVENGIRQHLGIGDNEAIRFMQLDTITTLDLSKRGITDINDLVLLPNLRHLDLNNNMVDDVRALTVLDSLEWVDLSYNNLKNINQMVYANAKNMTVNVAFNRIGDFSIFGCVTRCNFTFEGTGLQLNESAPFFDVCQLFCDATVNPVIVQGLVRTNLSEPARLMCGDFGTEVPANGEFFEQVINGNYSETVPVFLNNGILGDSTYLVPSITLDVNPGETLTLPTGLPESYTVYLTNPVHGTVVIDGTNLVYTAPDTEVSDTLSFSYYERDVLRGFSQYYLGKPLWLFGDVNRDKFVNITDIMMTVNYFIGLAVSGFYLENADYDKDGAVTVTEIMQIVNIALQSDNANSFKFCRVANTDKMLIEANAEGYAVSLCNNEPYTALQMDVYLADANAPLEVRLSDARADGHKVTCNNLGNGRYRIIVYSLNGQELRGNDGILLQLLTNSRLSSSAISNLLLTNRQFEPITMDDIALPTGIADVNVDENDAPAYNVQGVRSQPNTRGIVIQNGKKRANK